jgi:rhodanese-related sulfurtransferase
MSPAEWEAGPGTASDVEPAQVAEWIERGAGVQLVDVREPYERDAGHIAASRHIQLMQLASEAGTLERERPVVFYCRVGSRSEMAAQAFRTAGFEAYSMVGGLVRWVSEGRPLVPEDGHVADH